MNGIEFFFLSASHLVKKNEKRCSTIYLLLNIAQDSLLMHSEWEMMEKTLPSSGEVGNWLFRDFHTSEPEKGIVLVCHFIRLFRMHVRCNTSTLVSSVQTLAGAWTYDPLKLRLECISSSGVFVFAVRWLAAERKASALTGIHGDAWCCTGQCQLLYSTRFLYRLEWCASIDSKWIFHYSGHFWATGCPWGNLWLGTIGIELQYISCDGSLFMSS